MKTAAAYLLAKLGGVAEPTAGDIARILGSVGVDADADGAALLIKELEGKDVEEVITAGREKLQSVGGGVAVAGGAAGASAGGAAAPAAEEKVEEEEEDEDMGFSLFD
mmetsp:Transcript_11769/g.33202  ORF Transcript_11769/g.33202 Transcript_11769/m.33202 type:complete len:108 (+) Transcript_11769:86-409(+)